jgi:hypothetical protein
VGRLRVANRPLVKSGQSGIAGEAGGPDRNSWILQQAMMTAMETERT